MLSTLISFFASSGKIVVCLLKIVPIVNYCLSHLTPQNFAVICGSDCFEVTRCISIMVNSMCSANKVKNYRPRRSLTRSLALGDSQASCLGTGFWSRRPARNRPLWWGSDLTRDEEKGWSCCYSCPTDRLGARSYEGVQIRNKVLYFYVLCTDQEQNEHGT
jgi:hypothetical protein